MQNNPELENAFNDAYWEYRKFGLLNMWDHMDKTEEFISIRDKDSLNEYWSEHNGAPIYDSTIGYIFTCEREIPAVTVAQHDPGKDISISDERSFQFPYIGLKHHSL